jgi:hypothetical protein
MHLGGGDRRRIVILQGRNRLKGAQNNILRLKWFKSCQLTYTIVPKNAVNFHSFLGFFQKNMKKFFIAGCFFALPLTFYKKYAKIYLYLQKVREVAGGTRRT